MNNSRWMMNRVGLVDFWYYDDEEFELLDGRMLLRGANGSGKSVTMQSFIPLLLDGNMRPERLDPFGSRARKMENYLLGEGDGREERTGYLYMEFKRAESEEYLTIGIGIRARRGKKMDAWYFCITDGRRVGRDIFLYRDTHSKITCTMRELRNRIGEGGRVMESQSEYAQCVNRLLFGFETQEEYKELLELLIQLRTPKLSKDFKPSVINEILSGSLQTLSEDDLRPMSEAIENMDNLKTNLNALDDSIAAAEQIERAYDRYNEIVLYNKAALFRRAASEYDALRKQGTELVQKIGENRQAHGEETERYEALTREERVLQEERDSLADSDATRLKGQEEKLRQQLEAAEETILSKRKQESDKCGRQRETEDRLRRQTDQNELQWTEIEKTLENMAGELEGIPFDDFAFLRAELREKKEETYAFPPHEQLLRAYTQKAEKAKQALVEEKNCQERYSVLLQQLDAYQNEKNTAERELQKYENLLHEIRQELIEKIYRWAHDNHELHLSDETLQAMSRGIDTYRTDTDFWEIRELGKSSYDAAQRALSLERSALDWKRAEQRTVLRETQKELEEWRNRREPEPERSPETEANRARLTELGIPHLPFYKVVDFAPALEPEQTARLEEALLRMGVLDALIVPEEYREQVLAMDADTCDRYLFADAGGVRESLMGLFDIDHSQGDLVLYQQVSRILAAIGWRQAGQENASSEQSGTWIDADGNYGIGVLTGTISGTRESCFIGEFAREQYRARRIQELEERCRREEEALHALEIELHAVEERIRCLESEWRSFPGEQDLKVAAREYEKQAERLDMLNERIREHRQRVEAERKKLDAVRLQVQELCGKCYLPARLDVFTRALESLERYREYLTELRIAHNSYISGIRQSRTLRGHLEELAYDLDDIRCDLNRAVNRQRELEAGLASVLEQLGLTDYEKIRERLDYCTKRLREIPGERDNSVARRAMLQRESEFLQEKRQETEQEIEQAQQRREWLEQAFMLELRLDYVETELPADDEPEKQADRLCGMLGGKFGNRRQSDLLGSLQEEYHKNRGALLEYQITLRSLFEELDADTSVREVSMKRIDIAAKYRGVTVKFKDLIGRLREDAETQRRLLSDKDRELFEDILAGTISKKIRAKIQASKRWVAKMNGLMETMQTSSGLTLSLRWKNRRADREEQLDTGALVELLQKDAEIMRPEETEQLSRHFRSKIDEARKAAGDSSNLQSFHAIMREVLDYRQWFEFQLESQKIGERRKELTDRVFFTFSGGEKAMAMYVPLFSAVTAKYAGAREDAPRLISLDEAFAGVDEMNIRDMFRLMTEFNFNYMINSQILWGDYDTVPALAIYQLVRPENVPYVTVIRYRWNGTAREMLAGRSEPL